MADSMIVFVRNSKLPTVEQLRNKVGSLGLELEEWDINLADIEGYWPGRYKGEEAGFEFMAGEVDPDDLESWEVEEDALEGRDGVVELTYRTEADVYASVICTVALCQLSDGLAFDDDDALSVNANTCEEWAVDQGVAI